MMVAHYTAASLVSECKTLAHPDSVDSIPTSADLEDHVPLPSVGLGWRWHVLSQRLQSLNAAHHARTVVDNIEAVVARNIVT